jgi:hypothetical protein
MPSRAKSCGDIWRLRNSVLSMTLLRSVPADGG